MGREQQTLELVPRLLETAGYDHHDLSLTLVVDGDAGLGQRLSDAFVRPGAPIAVLRNLGTPQGYWKCLQMGTSHNQAPLIVNLANDLLPGRQWLGRAVDAFDERFADGQGIMGFNDGVHSGAHAAHFLASRGLLAAMFGAALWPLHYHHNYGDTEIVARAVEKGKFAVAPWAVLYHNHIVTGAANDVVYRTGMSTWEEDQATFARRQANRWQS